MNRKVSISAVISLVVVFCSLVACVGINKNEDDPKKRLSEYISKSFSVTKPEDRSQLLSYLSGESKTRLSAWSEEQFRQAFIESKRQFIKLLIRETKVVSPKEVSITYELTYLDQSRGKDAKVTNKKLCQMVLEQNRWLIAEVTNIKELVEYRNEMSLP
jgi:hypothetical protein